MFAIFTCLAGRLAFISLDNIKTSAKTIKRHQVTSWGIITYHKSWKNDENHHNHHKTSVETPSFPCFLSEGYPFRHPKIAGVWWQMVRGPPRLLATWWKSIAKHKTRVMADVTTVVLAFMSLKLMTHTHTHSSNMLQQHHNSWALRRLRHVENRSGQVMQRVHNGHKKSADLK